MHCLAAVPCVCRVQAELDEQGGDGEGGLQLDAAQLAEYRRLKSEADTKTSRLLQEKATLEAQLKVGGREGRARGWLCLVLCQLLNHTKVQLQLHQTGQGMSAVANCFCTTCMQACMHFCTIHWVKGTQCMLLLPGCVLVSLMPAFEAPGRHRSCMHACLHSSTVLNTTRAGHAVMASSIHITPAL